MYLTRELQIGDAAVDLQVFDYIEFKRLHLDFYSKQERVGISMLDGDGYTYNNYPENNGSQNSVYWQEWRENT